jgi:hypothetical protein
MIGNNAIKIFKDKVGKNPSTIPEAVLLFSTKSIKGLKISNFDRLSAILKLRKKCENYVN